MSRQDGHGGCDAEVHGVYLNDLLLHHRVQPLDERLHGGVFSQQLLQLLEDADGIVWRREKRELQEL